MRLPFALSALLLTVGAAPGAPPRDWHATALGDVHAAYDIFASNHPGMKNPADPAFPARLAAARDAALKVAAETRDETGYRAALAAFSAGLSDGHARVTPKTAAHNGAEIRWPGFTGAWRGDEALVSHAGPTSPAPAGSAIIACDGRPVRDFVRSRLLDMPFRPAEAGQWWGFVPFAFLSSSTSERGQAGRCTFRLPDGTTRETALAWSAAPPETWDILRRSEGELTPIGLSEPRPGMFLVGLPSFDPDESGVKAYRALYAEIVRRRPDLLKARAIVLDLRGNGGGSSEWSQEMARRLWGAEAVDRRMEIYHGPVRIWWRASPGNVAHVGGLEAKIRRNGQSTLADEVHEVAAGLKAALAAGRDYYVEGVKPGRRVVRVPPTDLRTPVYVITHGACASACLDAIDTFKRFPSVKLIGAPTSADTPYMDVRFADLPSGRGNVVIPLKAWIHRPRAAGEIYRPDIPHDALDWSTAAFLNGIEQDLAGRR